VDKINDITGRKSRCASAGNEARRGAGAVAQRRFLLAEHRRQLFRKSAERCVPESYRFSAACFFPTLPEASVARNSINADALWRVSDTTANPGRSTVSTLTTLELGTAFRDR
jgi:hypothetical protein